jgi:hypothetical protein
MISRSVEIPKQDKTVLLQWSLSYTALGKLLYKATNYSSLYEYYAGHRLFSDVLQKTITTDKRSVTHRIVATVSVVTSTLGLLLANKQMKLNKASAVISIQLFKKESSLHNANNMKTKPQFNYTYW